VAAVERSGGAGGRTAFVLCGGGSLGAVQVGMAYALLEAGIRPDLVVGSSVGALNGAHLAGHPSLEGVDELAGLWREVTRRDIFPLSLRDLGLAVIGRRRHIVDPVGLRTWILRAGIGFSRIEDAPVPLLVLATDMGSGAPVVLSEGDLIEALLASAAIPGIFPPAEVGGRWLVDGAIAADAPVVEALEAGASEIYLLPTSAGQGQTPPPRAADMVFRAMTVMSRRASEPAIEKVSRIIPVRVVPAPEAGDHSIFDFKSTRSLISESYELASAWLADGAPVAEPEAVAVGA
jgi:NTE family protein